MNYFAFTSMSQEYYNSIGFKMLETFKKFFPVDVNVYSEDIKDSLQIDNRVNKFLDDLGQSRARGFAYKAYSIIDAFSKDCDKLVFIDADIICFRTLSKDFLDTLNVDELVTYIGVTHDKFGSHSDSCFFIINKNHKFYNEFVKEYIRVYEERLILDNNIFVKPNDSYVLAHCIRYAEDHGHTCRDLHLERKSLSPIYETILGTYLRHFKASRKVNESIFKHIDKAIEGIRKGKSVEKVLERFDRRVRQEK